MNERTSYLDGLRGFAAFQVILLHYFTAFIPSLAFPGPYRGWSGFLEVMGGTPLYYFYDGNSAIYTFFLLSGYVLTFSYLKKIVSPWDLIVARTLRLGIPVSCSLVIAWILFFIFPHQHILAGQIAGSPWLTTLWNVRPGWDTHLKEIFLGSMLIGYGDTSFWYFFPSIYKIILPLSTSESLNFPLWTLNIEYYGSLLMIFLCALYRETKVFYFFGLALVVFYFQPFAISLFFVGHLFALAERKFPAGKPYPVAASAAGVLVGWILIGLGIWLSSRGIASVWLVVHFGRVPLRLVEKSIGAILIFGTILFFKRAGRFGRPLIALFEGGFFQFLGKRSFAVYLLHIPVLFTLSSSIYIYLSQFLSRPAVLTLTIFWGIFFTYLVSGFFEKYVDGYALAISKARSAKP
jgi:peptidoglycan/LPS O-acetylase OafA/YrhL